MHRCVPPDSDVVFLELMGWNMARYPGHWEFDEIYDAVDRGCGDFIMDLRAVVRALPPEGRLLIVSHEAGAPPRDDRPRRHGSDSGRP